MGVHVGSQLAPWHLDSVNAEKMKTMAALLRDPNPIHWDLHAVKALGMGDRVVNQGPNNMAYIVNMLTAWCGDSAAIRRVSVRFRSNVFAGDTLVASGVVRHIHEEKGVPVAECDVWLERADGDRVLEGTAAVVLDDEGLLAI